VSLAGLSTTPALAGGPDAEGGALIDLMLAEQGDLTAVERFSQFHEGAVDPIQGRYYASLMPASPPGPGQQLAFEVDLDRCSGCKACVTACHSLNGLDEHETWRDVGMILGGTPSLPMLQHVTTACHHCVDPACLSACPTEAYEKDPITGIVKHLDDQCFGCQYCSLACPYDVPKYHAAKGIVRKCDMCSDRLKVGEAPACVQACPSEAIRIRVVDVADVVAASKVGAFLPSAPHPDYTRPTTVYTTARPMAGPIVAADHHHLKSEHAHLPLVAMLVLTQAAVGGFLIQAVARVAGFGDAPALSLHAILAFGIGQVGLAAATLHLGRPHLAYRAILGIRHSWLSREVVAFGLFAAASGVFCGLSALQPGFLAVLPEFARSAVASALGLPPAGLGSFLNQVVEAAGRPWVALGLALGATALGLAGVATSVMVYHVCRRPSWRFGVAGTKFFGTAVVLGLSSWIVAAGWASVLEGSGRSSPALASFCLLAALGAKLAFEAAQLLPIRDEDLTLEKRSALLILGPLRWIWRARLALGILGGLVVARSLGFIREPGSPLVPAFEQSVGFVFLIGGELAERALFFAAVAKPKMPGR